MSKNLILKKERLISSPPSRIWDVLTKNEWIERWLGVQMLTDWKVGSPIAFTFTYKDKEIRDKGTLLHLEPAKKFAYNYWSVFSATDDKPENYSEISFDLSMKEEGTLLQLTQTNFSSKQQFSYAEKNWEETLDAIRELAEIQP